MTPDRRKVLALGAALPLVFWSQAARAAYFRPRMRANAVGNLVRVRIWISTNVGPLNLNNHYLGAFYVPKGGSLSRELNVGVATIHVVMKAKNQVVDATIKMLGAMFQAQQKVISASISH